MKLKHLSPELSTLCAQIVHARHKSEAARETKELRALMAELIRRGRAPADLIKGLLTGATNDAANPTEQTTTATEGQKNEVPSI